MHAFSVKGIGLVVVATLVAAGLVAPAPSSAQAAPVPCRETFTNPNDYAIPDGSGGVTADVDVPEDRPGISDLDVTVNIDHSYTADLRILVTSFSDSVGFRGDANMYDYSGSGADNLHGTVFDDQARTPITWADAPFTGRFLPFRSLAPMNGYAGGFYRLTVQDLSAGDTGTLTSWSVTLTYASCDLDADGVEDHRDSCLGVAAHTATGCPVTTRRLTASYGAGKFKGALSSPVTGCKTGRAVTIWKLRRGADAKVGTATTRADGAYKLSRAKREGRYYATAPRAAVTGVAECPAVTSATFRIR